jgi:dihydrofolate synthase / folylpolyglutamate synthase
VKRQPRLESLEKLGWRFGLETIQALLRELGNPETFLRVVHVAGSNGKGSTCAFMASFLRQCGYKTGLYTSPHLCDIRERFRINGTWISQGDFNRLTRQVLKACQGVQRKLGHLPTHFEALTAIAFCWFKEQKVDWLVLEVGLGGRLDATNVVRSPAVCLITPIALEHQNILGKTIGKIAWEKAGILKEGCLAATLQFSSQAARVIDRTAREKGAKLWLLGRDFTFRKETKGFYWEGPGLSRHFKLPDPADFQVVNVPLVIAGIQILRAFGVAGTPELIQESFAKTRWPGRAEIIRRNPLVLLDGAHNPSAAYLLWVFLESRYPRKRWVVLNGFLKDKDYAGVTRILRPLTAFAAVTEPESERAEDGMKVLRAWKKAGVPEGGMMRDWKRALTLALGEARKRSLPLLITGSLYLVGKCREQLVGKGDLAKI